MAQWGISMLGFAGLLRRIHHIEQQFKDPATVEVRAGENLRYGVFVEYGTGRGPEQPYMRPAAQTAQQNANEYWRRAVHADGPAVQVFPRLIAQHIVQVAQQLVPVDTGALRDSIRIVD